MLPGPLGLQRHLSVAAKFPLRASKRILDAANRTSAVSLKLSTRGHDQSGRFLCRHKQLHLAHTVARDDLHSMRAHSRRAHSATKAYY